MICFDDRILHSLNIPLSVETVCVFTAPIFSAFASWATYLLTKVSLYVHFPILIIIIAFSFPPFIRGEEQPCLLSFN